MRESNPQPGATHTFLWVLCVVFFTLELFVFTWTRVQCMNTGYEIHRELEEKKSLISLRSKLNVEHNYLLNLDRLKAIAKERLGLQNIVDAKIENDRIIEVR